MKEPKTFYLLTIVYIIIGVYFLLYSDYPLFILLFLVLAGYHYFLARVISNYKDEGPASPPAPPGKEQDLPAGDDQPRGEGEEEGV